MIQVTRLRALAGFVALMSFSTLLGAQTYPSKPMRLLVGFTAGGASDITARIVGQKLTERFGPAEAFGKYIREEIVKWRNVIERAGIYAD